MTKWTSIDLAILEKTKLDKVLPRLVKRGDDQCKLLAQRILDNATTASKQKRTDGKVSQIQETRETVKSKPPFNNNVRASDSKLAQPIKKLATASTMPLGANSISSTKATGISGRTNQSTKTDSRATKTAAAIVPAPKVKTNHIVAKPSAFFSSLQSASKKPGTSNAALQTAKSKDSKTM